MKAAIIKLSTLQKHGRWDAGYYLGKVEEKEKAVSRAEIQLKVASTQLLNASKALVDEIHRAKELERVGDVIPITGVRGTK